MSGDFVDTRDGVPIGATELLARAAAAEGRALHGLRTAVADFFMPEALRLDERLRTEIRLLLQIAVEGAEAALIRHFSALVGPEAAATVPSPGHGWRALHAAGALRDPELMGELLARVRLDTLGGALPSHAPDDPERPSLIARFVAHPDDAIADAARALLVAESRRRSPETIQLDLPDLLQRRLVWLVAAALRDQAGIADEPAHDVVLCEAARRAIADRAPEPGLEAAAMAFAARVAAAPGELPPLLVEALRDRRIHLFTAMLARATRLPYPVARNLVLEPGGERLLLALHMLDAPRDAIAEIGYMLCEADPRRDLDRLADAVDALEAISRDQARAALTPLSLDPEYRAARRVLAGAEGAP